MTKLIRYTQPLVIRLKPDSKERLAERAKANGKNLSEYIRDLVEDDERAKHGTGS